MMLTVASIMMGVVFTVLIAYTLRHYLFFWNRVFRPQRRSFQDLPGHYLPRVTVIVPMHDEEQVAEQLLDRLVAMDYPRDRGRYEVIVVNDHSSDSTREIIDRYSAEYPFIKALHRVENGGRGKALTLRAASAIASGEIILVFDADYLPSRNCVQRLVSPFCDVEVGLVMGRVVPINSGQTLLTRLLDLERAGGYQVDQQARYNLGLLPQFGGTVGGVRASVLESLGGWDVTKLTEDTDITYRAYLSGWTVAYVNIAECYEEVVTNWETRRRQLRRWAMGHNQCLQSYLLPTLRSPILRWGQKLDAVLLLGVYVVPVLILVGWGLGIYFYLFGAFWWWLLFSALLITFIYNNVGNFAAFNEVGTSVLLDRRGRVAWLLSINIFNFLANAWVCTGAAIVLGYRATKMKLRPPRYRYAADGGYLNGNASALPFHRWDKTPRHAGDYRNGNGNGNGNGHGNGGSHHEGDAGEGEDAS